MKIIPKTIREIKSNLDSFMGDFILFHQYRDWNMAERSVAKQLLLAKGYIVPAKHEYKFCTKEDGPIETIVDSYDWTEEGTRRFHEVMHHRKILSLLRRFYD